MKIKLDGLELNLTSEQVEDLKRQLEVKQEILPTTWLEAFEIVKPIWYLSSSGELLSVSKSYDLVYEGDCPHHVPTEKHTKSVLAMCKLMTIAEAYNQGVKGKLEYAVIDYGDLSSDERLEVTDITHTIYGNPILFKKEEHAEHCLEHFKELWNDFFMV